MRVQRYLAGVVSGRPAAATARTWKVWAPMPTLRANGERHGLKGRLSSLHSNPAPGWSELKVNRARRFVVRFGGCLPSAVAGVAAGPPLVGPDPPPWLPPLPTPPPATDGGATRLIVV